MYFYIDILWCLTLTGYKICKDETNSLIFQCELQEDPFYVPVRYHLWNCLDIVAFLCYDAGGSPRTAPDWKLLRNCILIEIEMSKFVQSRISSEMWICIDWGPCDPSNALLLSVRSSLCVCWTELEKSWNWTQDDEFRPQCWQFEDSKQPLNLAVKNQT